MAEQEINWLEALRTAGAEHPAVVGSLRKILLDGLRHTFRGRTDVSEAHLEDFTQDALLRVLDSLDQFSGRSKFTTWAHTIALNIAFTEMRRKRWQDVSLDRLQEEGRQLSEPAVLPENALGREEERVRLVDALRQGIAERLSDRQRTAIACELRELPFDQIVHVLGTNRNAAYKLLHDARKALKQHLAAAGICSETIRTAFAA